MQLETESSCRFDLAIVLRIYPRISKTPAVFPDDKLSLVSLGLHSLREALYPLRARIDVLLDGCPPIYEDLCQQLLSAHKCKIYNLPGIGNAETWLHQIRVLLEQSDCRFVFFAEDDYFYLPHAFSRMLAFLRTHPTAGFVTPYDHLDYYKSPVHRYRSEILLHEGQHWREVASTCMTFLTTRETLRRHERLFQTYAHGNFDSSMWWATTKLALFSPRLVWSLTRRQDFMKLIVPKVWKYGWRTVLFKRRTTLWAPLPSLATHLEAPTMAPVIDWQREFRRVRSTDKTDPDSRTR